MNVTTSGSSLPGPDGLGKPWGPAGQPADPQESRLLQSNGAAERARLRLWEDMQCTNDRQTVAVREAQKRVRTSGPAFRVLSLVCFSPD